MVSCSPRASFSLLLAGLAISACLALWARPALAACAGEDGGGALVTEIRGGDTLILQDDRAVRLAGVLLPRRAGEADIGAQARQNAEKTLADLVLSQRVELQFDARRRDRYGRLLAQVHVVKDGKRLWVQEQLIASGLARVISFRDNRICIPQLLAAERTAREAGQGLWKTGLFSVRQAGAEDLLAARAQNYEIVEGRIENVAEIRGRYYLNFGRNWRRDFTITVSSDAARLFSGESGGLANLKGRLVRARGWIENVNGPSISLTHPEQMEILESGTALQQ